MLACQNITNMLPDDSSFVRDFLMRKPFFPKLKDSFKNFWSYFVKTVTVFCLVPVFLFAILHVISVRTQKEVSRIHTFGVVTMMANEHSIGQISKMENPRNSMSSQSSSSFWTLSHFSIPSSVQSSFPLPAFSNISLINFSPKTFFNTSVCISKAAHIEAHYPNLHNMQAISTEKEGFSIG